MRQTGIAVSMSAMTLVALSAFANVASAAVLISSFQFKICVTGAKHPDGCKDVGADARVVVSDDLMETVDGEIGQGATITQAPDKGLVPASGGQGRRRRHLQQ